MDHRLLRGSLIALCLLVSAANVRAQAPAGLALPDSAPPRRVVLVGAVEVPIELERGLPMVSVRVNGRGPFRFGIETGARLIGISPALAESLALPRVPGDSLGFAVDSLSVPGARLEGLRVTAVRAAQPGLDGLLGLPAFEELLLTLDYPGHRLVLARGELPAADGREVLPMSRVGPFWGVPIGLAGRAVVAILDTRSTGGLGLTPGDTASVRWAGPLEVIGMARGAAIAPTPVLGGRLADDVTLGRYRIATPFVSVRALPPGFPHEPILGARALGEFVLTLDQRHARARFVRPGDAPIVLPEPRRAPATGAPR